MSFSPTRRQLTVLAVAVGFAVLPPLLSTIGVLNRSTAFDLGVGACFAAMAMSLNLLMGYAGQISLGHGALLAVGGYSAGLIAGQAYLPAGLAWLVAAVMGGVFAFLVGLPALRLRGLYLAVTTIGFQVLMENSLLKWRTLSRGSGGLDIPRPYVGRFGFNDNADYLSLILLVALLLWVLDANVVRTKFGRAFFGVRDNEQVAQSFGIDVARYKLLAFTMSGAMAGVAGAVYSHLIRGVSSETFNFQAFSLFLVALVVIGGLGSRVGVVVAAGTLGVLPAILDWFEGWDLVLGAALLVYTVARHPGGLAEAIAEARHARATKDARRTAEEAAREAEARGESVPDPAEGDIPPLPALPRPSTLPERPALASGQPMLEVRDVTVRFGGLVAVNKASVRVDPGRIVGLIGPNGAGKSTLFNAVSGFVPMESGTIELMGRRIEGLPSHQRALAGLGRTFQHIGLARNLSVLENLLLAQHQVATYDLGSALGYLPRAGRMEEELRERSREAIAALGFEAFTDTPVKHLSGGQQRIVEIACALVTAPDLLLLDEPSAGMAPAAVENLAGRLRDLRDELGRTVLVIEHHIPLVLDVCDEVYVLNFGEVLASGTPAEITQRADVIAAYLGESAEAPATAGRARRRTRREAVPV